MCVSLATTLPPEKQNENSICLTNSHMHQILLRDFTGPYKNSMLLLVQCQFLLL